MKPNTLLLLKSFFYEKVNSYDGCQYICKTCDTKLNKTHMCVNNLAYVEYGTHLPV